MCEKKTNRNNSPPPPLLKGEIKLYNQVIIFLISCVTVCCFNVKPWGVLSSQWDSAQHSGVHNVLIWRWYVICTDYRASAGPGIPKWKFKETQVLLFLVQGDELWQWRQCFELLSRNVGSVCKIINSLLFDLCSVNPKCCISIILTVTLILPFVIICEGMCRK